MSASDGLGPLPEAVHHWRTDVPGRAGPLLSPLFTADQMHAFRAAGVAAERERCARLCDAVAHVDGTGYGIAEDCAAAIRGGLTSGFIQANADEAPRIDFEA